MGLNTSRPRGAGEQPDRVLRSPARWSFITLGVLIALAGVAVAIGAAVAPLDRGEHRSVTAALLGAQLALLGGTVADGLTLPAGVTPRRHIPWDDVVEVAAVGG